MRHSFRELFIWRAGVDVAAMVSSVADVLLASRRYALVDQMQRSSISISSNIAEGHGRTTQKDRRHFLAQARGSAYELETQLEIAVRLAKLPAEEIAAIRDLVAKITCGLTRLIDRLA
jgi:four helix bundle protein